MNVVLTKALKRADPRNSEAKSLHRLLAGLQRVLHSQPFTTCDNARFLDARTIPRCMQMYVSVQKALCQDMWPIESC